MRKTYAPISLVIPLRGMLSEMKANRLEIVLCPAPEQKHLGHKIRVVTNQNPEWYQELCLRHESTRKNKRKRNGKKHFDTKIKRRNVLHVLEQFCNGEGTCSPYAFEILTAAREWQLQQEELREEYEAKTLG